MKAVCPELKPNVVMSQQYIVCSALIRCLMLQAMLSLLACAMEVAAAGVLTARKQFTFLVGAMLLSLGTVAAYCSAVRTYNWGLSGVWWGESLLQGAPPGSVLACRIQMYSVSKE